MDLQETIIKLLRSHSLWQILDELANVIDKQTANSPSGDYKQLGKKIRQAKNELSEFCGRGD